MLSEVTKPRPSANLLARLAESEGACAISSVTWHELWFGTYRLGESRRQHQLEEFLRMLDLPILAYDVASAHLHARRRAELALQGLFVSYVDGQFARLRSITTWSWSLAMSGTS